jgi:hypothetical protein
MKIETIFAKVFAVWLMAAAGSGSTWAQTPGAASDNGSAPASASAPAAQPVSTLRDTPPAAPEVKKEKGPYTGTWDVMTLPPTPMLDHEGKQRVDPDGNLMFNPAVNQIRDKKGHPVVDVKGQPVFQTANDLGYDMTGKKLKAAKVKPPKMTPMSITDGLLTVDGWTGKARLNYDIADLKYLYLYTPGIGTTIVSQNPFPGAKQVPGAFDGKSLKITVDGHPIELSSSKLLLGKKPLAAWVVVDREYSLPVKAPVLGYGTTTKFPYAWPGSKDQVANGSKLAPPLPVDVQPTLALSACPKGMMRPTGSGRLPGQKAVEEPCVLISMGASASASATAVTSGGPER